MRRIFCFAGFALAALSPAIAGTRCELCGTPFASSLYYVTDGWTGKKRELCGICAELKERCTVCEVPVRRPCTEVGDGRVLCDRDAKIVVLDDDAARQVLADVRLELDRLLSRFLVLPSTNIHLSFEGQAQMRQHINAPGYERQCPSLRGVTRSLRHHGGRWEHEVRLLKAMPRSEMIGVYAHEYGHAWLKENLPADRRLFQAAAEGFCELLGYQILKHLGETEQIERLKENGYTQGQIECFIRVLEDYDWQVILDWIKHGRDPYLIEADLDRVRQVDMPLAESPATVLPPVDPSRVGRVEAPNRLLLRGLLGSGPRRVALVNDTALAAGETANVRVSTNLVRIRCLEVGENRARVQMVGTGEQLELRLGDSGKP